MTGSFKYKDHTNVHPLPGASAWTIMTHFHAVILHSSFKKAQLF